MPQTPIALVGIGLRFPQADSPDAFFDLLEAGVDGVTRVPADRWDAEALAGDGPGKTRAQWGGFLGDVTGFDAGFFGIAPREAARMDPQQRLLLEVAWEALEDAGMPTRGLAGTPVGVFVGASTDDHTRTALADPTAIDVHTATGASLGVLANRLSYLMDFTGPSMVVDTACSSSLLAVHLACRSLAAGESSLAIAGGVNLMLNPALTISFSRLNALSPDGRCKTFDASANGYVRAEGVAVVVLKRLEEAVADGDRIYAVIRGSAVNQDGRSNGLTAPSRRSQEAVLRAAYAAAGVAPSAVQYVEAHGTGTLLGDPIEVKALGAVMGEGREAGTPCLVGSVKTNIGHAESAAGVAGLIKTALCLHRRRLVPSLHFETPNPYIPFAELPVRVVTRGQPWPAAPGEGLAGVSAFGFGGTNVHVALTEAPCVSGSASDDSRAQVLALSARDEGALKALASAWVEKLGEGGAIAALCRAAALNRDHHARRLSVVGDSADSLRKGLAAYLAGSPQRKVAWGVRPHRRQAKRAFVFCGQGAQWVGMGQDLLRDDPVFAEAVAAIDAHFLPLAGWSIAQALAQPEGVRWEDTEVAQPALFAVQVGLAAVLASRGILPEHVVGHSAGEIAAAHVAGVLSLEDAVRVVHHRGRILQRATGFGGTAALGVSRDEAVALIAPHGEKLTISGVNGPRSVTVAGEVEALAAVLAACEAQGNFARRLPVAYAFHHPSLVGLGGELEAVLAGLCPQEARVPLYSTLTGDRTGDYGPAYWGRQLAEPVAFEGAIATMAKAKAGVFLEVGPHPVLGGAIEETLEEMGLAGVVISTQRRSSPGREELLAAIGSLYALGEDLVWPEGRGHAALPTYPWQRETFKLLAAPAARFDSWLGARFEPATSPGVTFWQRPVSVEGWPSLQDHRVGEAVVVPGAAYVDWALLAGREVFGDVEVSDVAFRRALVVPDGETMDLQMALTREDEGARFEVFARRQGQGEWTLHASARLAPRHGAGLSALAGGGQAMSGAEHYALMRRRGLNYGPAYQGVRAVRSGAGQAEAEVACSSVLDDEVARHAFTPAFLDAAMQLVGPAVPGAEDGTYMPVGIRRFRLLGAPGAKVVSRTVVLPGAEPDTFEAVVTIDDVDGRRVAEVEGLVVRRVDAIAADPDRLCYQTRWERRELPDSGDAACTVIHASGETPFEAALSVLVALREAAGGKPVCVVTRGACQVANESIDPSQAAAYALARVAVQEYTERYIIVRDLPIETTDADLEALERSFGLGDEDQLAIRGGEVFSPRLTPHAFEREAVKPSPDGTHLVTGGLGGIGLGLAGWLVDQGARHLALVGRSAPSTEAEARLAAWRDAGVDVRVYAADISREEAVSRLLSHLEADMPPLAGIYHAAGVLSVETLDGLEPDSLQRTMGAKVDGARHLHRLTAQRSLEAFVLFGSAAATLGSHGQGAYAAANAYLGALARQRRANGLVATCIAWGPWAGIGMAAGAEEQAHLRAVGLAGIPAPVAYRLLGRAMASEAAEATVVDLLPSAYKAAWPQASSSPFLSGLFIETAEVQATGELADRLRALPVDERRPAIEGFLAEALSSALGRSPESLDRGCPLNALGLDSLMGLQVRNRVARDLGVSLAMMDLLKGPTIEELASVIAPRLGEQELTMVVPQALNLATVLAEPERLLAAIPTMSEAELDRWIAALEQAP